MLCGGLDRKMKIIEVVLYSIDGHKRRIIEFNTNGVTIISGKDKTGKTALLEIVQYCLGSSDCRIPEGVIKNNVSWYGIKLQFKNEQMFIARKNPDEGKQTTNKAMYIIKQTVETPLEAPRDGETNIEDIVDILTNKVGIIDNLHKPDQEHTRNNLEATIKHTLFYCFQDQNDIGTKKYLFHKQSEEFMPQAMKDTLPYLLGAIKEDRLKNENELTIKKRELNKLKKGLQEAKLINGNNFNKAHMLLTQAQDIGLINSNITGLNSLQDYSDALKSVLKWNPKQMDFPNYSYIDSITLKIDSLKKEKRQIDEQITSTMNFLRVRNDYKDEIDIQVNRLESIGLYNKLTYKEFNLGETNAKLSSFIPFKEQIQDSLLKLNGELKDVERETPKLLKYIEELKLKSEKIVEEIELCEREIDALYQQEEIANRYKELNTRVGIVIGKIMLWLESIEDVKFDSDLEYKIKQSEREVNNLENLLVQENVEDNMTSILNRIGTTMTLWAQKLELEHSNNPIRFDFKNLTIVSDSTNKPIPLEKMGGGANWVGFHLVVYFALHKHFVENNCPIPRFIFFDQPSQAYFPEELKSKIEISDNMLKDEDREAINKLYEFIFDVVEELKGSIQVIITDHAMLNNHRFKESLKEIWRKGEIHEALIPKEWYE